MLRTKLGKAILTLFLVMMAIPLAYSYGTGGESLFPTLTPTNTPPTPYQSPTVINTSLPTPYRTLISQSPTPLNDLLTPSNDPPVFPNTRLPIFNTPTP